ncbi:DGQHR domain-containing protein [uncultured Shewanella sp.]|uniref:DGQHR domain-containing protein n=1 Tax=uncultured Shewanella sp. TaxID=173975 RepID=UPI002631D142|nr:DGQHR domain-containing protein [uncultured Shewanella sp.]
MKIVIDAIKISQPVGDFYYGKINAELLFKISEADVRRLESESEERDVENYLGIQRPLKNNRVNEIKNYISTLDATFPNSIIIAINEEGSVNISWEDNKLIIEFDSNEQSKIANILDGQHRLAGFDADNFTFEDFKGEKKDFELLVTIFVNANMSVQAKVFSMVNQNQTKVNKSLVYDLESLSKSRSPWKTSHLIAVYLNSKHGSPFYHRIKRLGVKSKKDEVEPLTQAAFVDNLVKLISPIPQEDRNCILGKDKAFFSFNNKKFKFFDDESLIKYPFRKLFFGNEDKFILKVIFDFFIAVESVWPKSWDKLNVASVLNKTVGLIALFRLLGYIVKDALNNDIVTLELKFKPMYFEEILSSLEIDESYFENLDAVSKSSSQIFKDLSNKLNKN